MRTGAGSTAFDALAGDDPRDDLHARIKAELVPGERLLWAGQPTRDTVDRASWQRWAIWFVAIASVLLAGLSIDKEPPLTTPTEKIGGGLVILGLVAGSIYAIAFVWTLHERSRERRSMRGTLYALTHQRAIRWSPAPGRRGVLIETIPAQSLGSVHRVECPGGVGDVKFGGNVPHGTFLGFDGIAEVRRVELLARSVLLGSEYQWRDQPMSEDH